MLDGGRSPGGVVGLNERAVGNILGLRPHVPTRRAGTEIKVDAANIESDCVDARRSLRARTMLQEGQEVEFIVDIPEEEAAVATTVASQVRGIVWLENRGPREMRFDS